MKFTIIPFQGTDKLKLNLTSKETRDIFPDKFRRRFKKANIVPTDSFRGFHVYYDEDDRSEAIEFWEPEIFLNGIQLMGADYNIVKDMFEKLDDNLDYEEGYGFDSIKYQIGINAPYGKVESVLVGRKGYYEE